MPLGGRFFRGMGSIPHLDELLVGYRRPFGSLDAARQALGLGADLGHANKLNVDLHASLASEPRESDFAAFYYLAPHAPNIRRIFDFGGNVGNLFYYYPQYLSFPEGFAWDVLDLPEVMAAGREIASSRAAHQLLFSGDFANASGADLFIASGSMHYFDTPLPRLIGELSEPPRLVLVNRTPITNGEPFATVQDAGAFRVPCMVYNRNDLIAGFRQAGYTLLGIWPACELSLQIPMHPEQSVDAYTGFMFKRQN